MDSTTQSASPLRQRMLDDMRMRKLEPKTQEAYIRAVRKLAVYLKRSPDTATVEDLRNFQLHLVDTGTSPITLNATLSGLKFFFDITLGRIELMARMQPVKVPRTLPVVLSPGEVTRLIAAARNVKHQAALSVAYGAGLRASEVISLKVTDVDSQRMTLRVEQGKGAKDRYAMLSPVLLQRRKRSANPSFHAAMKLRTSCLGNQRTRRGEYGSAACAAVHGAGAGLSRLGHEGQGLGRSQRRAAGNAGQLVCALPTLAGQA